MGSFYELEWLAVAFGEDSARTGDPARIFAIFSTQATNGQKKEHPNVSWDPEHHSYLLLVEAFHRACVIT